MKPNYKKIISQILKAGFILLGFVVVIAAVERKETQHIKKVNININPINKTTYLLDSVDILRSIERSFGYPLTAELAGQINTNRIEKVLNREPFVYNAEVHLDAQNNINIVIDQRIPLVRIFDKRGEHYFLDDLGHKLPISSHSAVRLITATGISEIHNPDYLLKEQSQLKDLYQLCQFIKSDSFWNSMIDQIHHDTRGFVLIPKIGNQKIVLGNTNNLKNKFDRLWTFYNEAISRFGWTKYRIIDLRYNKQIIAK